MAVADREYQMLFKLGAQLGQNFTGTFNSAQKVLQATQKKIQELNKLQSDVNAYQRQQSGIEKTNQKLEMYREQLNNTQQALAVVRKEIQENGGTTSELAARESDLANKEATLQNRIRDTEIALNDKNNRLKEMDKSLTEAGVDTGNLTTEAERLGSEMSELRQEEEKAAAEAENFGKSGANAFEAVASALVSAGIVEGMKKIAEAYAECVEMSMEFEATMSTVEALSGASAEEMNELTAEAKALGASTVFTANQAAEAMTYMGMAGWDAQEMLDGMNAVMALAAASGEDLALVSDIVTDNLTAFGLTAKDTAHFSDVLAAAATNSNTSVSIMGETFSGSAAIAGALGYSIEDVATAVGLMANAGVKGSVAGTALKNTFNGLLNGATLTSKAFGEVEFSAINADGTIDSLSDSISELRGYFEQMTEAERVQNAMTLAGQRGYNGLLAILNSTEEEYDSLAESISGCSGAAQEMADIKLDNLQGDVTLLQSATDGLKTSVGSLYRDELRSLVQLGTKIMSGLQEFIEENPVVTKQIITSAAAVGTLTAGYMLFTKAKKAVNAVRKISAALKATETSATAAGTAATTANTAATAAETAAEGANTVATTASTAAKLANAAAVAGVTIAVAAVVAELAYYADAIWGVSDAVEDAQNATQSIIDTMNDSIGANDAEISILRDKVDAYDELRLKQNRTATEEARLAELADELQDTLGDNVEVVNSLTGGYNDLSAAIDNYVAEQTKKVKMAALESAAQDAYKQLAEIEREMEERTAEYKEKANKLEVGDFTIVGAIHYAATGDTLGGYTEEYKWMKDMAALREEKAKLIGITEEYEDALGGEKQAEAESAEAAAAMVTSYDAVEAAVGSVTDEVQSLITAYNDAYQAAYDSVSGQFSLWDEAAEAVPTTIGSINDALASQQSYWSLYNDNLESLKERTGDIEGLSDVIASFADGSTDSVNAIAGMADATDDELRKMVELYQKNKEVQDEVSRSISDFMVDVDGQMQEFSDDMTALIEDMDLSDSAKSSAESTIRAYAQAIIDGRGSVADAAGAVSAAMIAALNPTMVYSYSPESTPDYAYDDFTGYASGTDYAESGFAIVGENGPEIVQMSGGEKVYTADETKEMLGGSTQIVISPSFVVNGSTDRDSLNEFSDELIERVLDAISEAGIDRKRSAYA